MFQYKVLCVIEGFDKYNYRLVYRDFFEFNNIFHLEVHQFLIRYKI